MQGNDFPEEVGSKLSLEMLGQRLRGEVQGGLEPQVADPSPAVQGGPPRAGAPLRLQFLWPWSLAFDESSLPRISVVLALGSFAPIISCWGSLAMPPTCSRGWKPQTRNSCCAEAHTQEPRPRRHQAQEAVSLPQLGAGSWRPRGLVVKSAELSQADGTFQSLGCLLCEVESRMRPRPLRL